MHYAEGPRPLQYAIHFTKHGGHPRERKFLVAAREQRFEGGSGDPLRHDQQRILAEPARLENRQHARHATVGQEPGVGCEMTQGIPLVTARFTLNGDPYRTAVRAPGTQRHAHVVVPAELAQNVV
jgi:hypothetical protein